MGHIGNNKFRRPSDGNANAMVQQLLKRRLVCSVRRPYGETPECIWEQGMGKSNR